MADLPEDDWRRTNPRFQEEALRENIQLADGVHELAAARGVTPAQLALAWVMAKGEDIVPIPGTKSPGSSRGERRGGARSSSQHRTSRSSTTHLGRRGRRQPLRGGEMEFLNN